MPETRPSETSAMLIMYALPVSGPETHWTLMA